MLTGVKFIPREQLQRNSDSDDSGEAKERSRSRKRKHERRRKKPSSGSSDDGEGMEDSAKKRSERQRKSKRRFSSEDDSSGSSDSAGESESLSDGEYEGRSKRSKRSRSRRDARKSKQGKESRKKRGKRKSTECKEISGDESGLLSQKDNTISRKEMGLEWMLSSGSKKDNSHEGLQVEPVPQVEEVKPVEEVNRANRKELNPYLKDNGSGYPDDASLPDTGNQLLSSSSVVGDGGVSWRLKALKRAKEQAAREGRKLDEVVEERWGSLGQLATSVAARRAAPVHAHLHAIKDRKKGQIEKSETVTSGELKEVAEKVNSSNRDYLRDVSSWHPEMRKPKQDYSSWKKNKGQNISSEDRSLISAAISGINKFANDGNFMDTIIRRRITDTGASNSSPHANIEANDHRETELDASTFRKSAEECTTKQALNANQLAAKVLQLRMKGKHEEAEKLSKEMEAMVEKQDTETSMSRQEIGESTRYIGRQITSEKKRREEDADFHLAQNILQNKKYSLSGRADDEYDFDDAPSRKHHRKRVGVPDEKINIPTRFLTQQERCQFCFENPSRPKHLVISIANFTYMMLPQWQPVVQGHCCILPMQHDSSIRTVDKNVGEELRNFKKCLLKMFARQDKDVVFLETVIDLAKQRRHCLIECIPVPCELAKQAPMYFKKAIDEAEEEWGQHEMKKVIPTSGNLRHVIPENFSYFHVEFGLDRGFVHVIDDESNFKSSFGLNVIRGMLRLPEEDMHRRRRHEPVEKQMQAVASFAKEWDPFDWTRQLD